MHRTMTLALLKYTRFVVNQPSKRYYVCSCQHFYALGSIEADYRWRHFSTHGAVYPRSKYTAFTRGRTLSLTREYTWLISSVHYNSQLRHSAGLFTNLSLADDCLIKRSFHSTVFLAKEDTVVEKSLKNLKDKVKPKPVPQKPITGPVSRSRFKLYVLKISGKWSKFVAFIKQHGFRGVLRHMWEEMKFYKDGLKLFYKDLRICLPLSFKYLTKGRSTLTRREYRLLKQTLVDLLLMIPILPTLIIPFMEVLIPVFLWVGLIPKVFISKEKRDGKIRDKLQRKIESAQLLVDSLNNMPLIARSKNDDATSSVQEFTEFMDKVKSSEVIPPIEEILQFSRLFENSLTLDDLSIKQLQGLCKLLGIGFLSDIPNTRVLRFQIDTRMRELTVDDKFILRDGIDSLNIDELQAANRARGMRALGISEERLKIQLDHWLELHLKEQVPSSLLLLSRVMYLDENLSPAEQLKQTISSLPDNTVDKVKVTSAESRGEKVDKKTKIKVLEEETKAIQMEREQAEDEERVAKEKLEAQHLVKEERRLEEEHRLEKEHRLEQLKEEEKRKYAELALQMMDSQRIIDVAAQHLQAKHAEKETIDIGVSDATQPEVVTAQPDIAQEIQSPEEPVVFKLEVDITEDVKPIDDIAEPIIEFPREELVDVKAESVDAAEEMKQEVDEDITAQDLGDIEKAIEDQARHYKGEIAEVVEDLDEYKEDVEDIKALCLNNDYEKEIEETLSAKRLLKLMNKLVKQFDKTISQLHDEKMQIQETIDKSEVSLKYDLDGKREEILQEISDKKTNLISINDVLLSVKRFQKVPNDVRMQKVLQILDTDHDGLININHVLKVTEALGRENLKLNKEQVTTMMNLVEKETEIELEEKMKEKEEKEQSKHSADEENDLHASRSK